MSPLHAKLSWKRPARGTRPGQSQRHVVFLEPLPLMDGDQFLIGSQVIRSGVSGTGTSRPDADATKRMGA